MLRHLPRFAGGEGNGISPQWGERGNRLAERVGFEPTRALQPYTLSRRA